MPFKNIKYFIRPLYYFLEYYKIRLVYALKKDKISDYLDIPIIINNRNRVTFLRKLIVSLEKRGLKNIHILDNLSTYPPLLEYYKTCPYEIIYLGENLGHKALWKSAACTKFLKDYFVYTDSDIEIIPECPDDFLKLFFKEMKSNVKIDKIGLGIKIDDIPDHFANKQTVINWESQYYNNKVSEVFYKANVDTTFALYRPGLMHASNIYLHMLRADFPYQIRHLPWYINSHDLDKEETFYVNNVSTITHWTAQVL